VIAIAVLIQRTPVAVREWTAAAVHDSVRRLAEGSGYRRSLQQSLLARALVWLEEHIDALIKALRAMPSARTVVVTILSIVALLIAARLVVSAVARDDVRRRAVRRGGQAGGGDPWREAESLASTGYFEGAAHALYRAVLHALAESDRIRIGPTKTSGDYARELRARGSPRGQAFRAFVRRFDATVYGRGPCDAGAVAELRGLANPFLPQARAA
jgi:hypothetical protein